MDKPYIEIHYLNGEEWVKRLSIGLIMVRDLRGVAIWKTYRIGRHENCEVCINWVGSLLSRFQLTLLRDLSDSDYTAIDGIPLKLSANGIKINGEKVVRKKLTHGDVIMLNPMIKVIYFNRIAIAENYSEITLTDVLDHL